MIDIYHSRRGKFRKCEYWLRDESDSFDINSWVLKNKPQGIFYATEVNAISNQANPINNAIMFDKNMVAISTDDDIEDISRGCIVLYNGKTWIVDNVQAEIHKKETEFQSGTHATWTLSLRR